MSATPEEPRIGGPPLESVCPKCKTPRDPLSMAPCRKCGLAATHMAGFAEKQDADIPDVLKTQWTTVTGAWTEQSHHDELLRLVTQHDVYAWGVARYRDIEQQRPDDAIAKQQIERLRRAAEVTLFSTATRRADDAASAPYRSTRMILALLIVCAFALMIYGWLAGRQPPRSPEEVPPVPAPVEQVR